jgi:hypothetical protein
LGIVDFVTALSACASIGINMKGEDYFVGKPESELTKYFGYEGIMFDGEEEYDRIVYFTNKVMKFEMSKTTVQRYKVSKSKTIYSFTFSERDDGCLVNDGNSHYTSVTFSRHGEFGGQHINDNTLVKSNITFFNNEVKRLSAVSRDYQQVYFDKSSIGDWFFVYDIYQHPKVYYSLGTSITPSENYRFYTYYIWRVDVVADDKATTTKYIAAIYDDRSARYYDGSWNIVSEEQAQAIYDEYIKKGFMPNTITEGFSVLAYIKDGKVVKVE